SGNRSHARPIRELLPSSRPRFSIQEHSSPTHTALHLAPDFPPHGLSLGGVHLQQFDGRSLDRRVTVNHAAANGKVIQPPLSPRINERIHPSCGPTAKRFGSLNLLHH